MIGQTFQSYRNVPATMAGTSTTSLPTPPLWKQMASASGQRAAIKNWLPFQKKTLKKLCATQHRNPQRRNRFEKPTEPQKYTNPKTLMNSRGGYGGEHWSLNERAIPLSHQQIYSSPYYLKCKTTCAALCLCSLIFISNSARLSDEFTRRHPAKNEGSRCASK